MKRMSKNVPIQNSSRPLLGMLLMCFTIALAQTENPQVPDVITGLSMQIEPQSIKIVPASPSKAQIIGRVKTAYWTGYNTYTDTEWVKVPVYTGYHYELGKRVENIARYDSELRKVTKRKPERTESYMPSVIMISVPYCKRTVKADVLSDGQFSSFVELDDGYCFQKDQSVAIAPGYSWWQAKRDIDFLPQNPKDPRRFGGLEEGYKYSTIFYFIDVNKTLANDLLTLVKIDFAEKNSRVPVKPDVTITMEDGPSFASIKSEWGRKYDSNVVRKLEETHDAIKEKNGVGRILKQGEVEEIKDQDSIQFWAYVGSSLMIETRDQNFYYFKSSFKADRSPVTKRTVLLVEIGSKTRSDDEGHGGQIISE
jgi:hypothetical protein